MSQPSNGWLRKVGVPDFINLLLRLIQNKKCGVMFLIYLNYNIEVLHGGVVPLSKGVPPIEISFVY